MNAFKNQKKLKKIFCMSEIKFLRQYKVTSKRENVYKRMQITNTKIINSSSENIKYFHNTADKLTVKK